jgi:hypothetical protein
MVCYKCLLGYCRAHRAPPLAPPLRHSHLRVSFSHVQPLLSIFNLAQRRVNAAVCLQVPHSAALAVAALQNARRRCVTCIVTDHPSNGVLISRIVGLADRLRNLKLSKASLYFIFLFCEYFQLTAQQLLPHSAALAVAALQNARRRCVTCIVTDHPSNGVLISRIVGLADRLRNLKLSKASLYFIFLFCEYFQLTAQQDPEVSCEARCAEDLIARLSDGQMKADGALLLSNLS